MTAYLQISTTVGSREEADGIAHALVERRLAGCVQVAGPIHSVYRWGGQVEQGDEWVCVVKTSAAQYPAVEAAILALHSYRCPEIIATPIVAGSKAYLAWLADQIPGGG